MQNIMYVLEFCPDLTTDNRVTCSLASQKYPHLGFNGGNGVSSFSWLFTFLRSIETNNVIVFIGPRDYNLTT